MSIASRGACLAAFVLLLTVGACQADLIFLKDGHVVQGTVRREVSAELDPVSREMILIPKGFFMLDDGPRRIYFSPSQVRIVEKLPPPPEERVFSHSGRLVLNPRFLPPHLEVLDVGKWDLKRWEREYAFRSPDAARVGVKQGIATLSPYFARVDAVTKFRWSAAYLTREWEPETVLELLKSSPVLTPAKNDKPPVLVAKRMRICDFLAQAGWYDHAEKELDLLVKDHPDQKERIASARTMIAGVRTREEWEEIKNWYQAGRYEAVRKRLSTFPTRDVSDRILADVREMKARLQRTSDLVEQAVRALDDTMKEATTTTGKSLVSAALVIKNELHPATIDRLDAFVSQVRDAERQKGRGKKPAMGPEQLLSLAVTGWLLGSPSAEALPEAAINLWKTRQMVLEYQQEGDAVSRKKILADYLAKITPRVDLDEIAQLISSLPPADPVRGLGSQVSERQAGARRQQTTYFVKLPPEYTPSRSYPVLLVLHQVGEKPAQIIERFAKHAADHGYILAAPQWGKGLASAYEYSEREHDAALDTIRDLKRRFHVDDDRVFLFGWGEGGRMAFDVGLAHPDLFAGVLPMAAGPTLYPRRYWRNAQYLPFYVVNGTRGADSQTLLRDQFGHWIQRGFPALWVEYKGRGTEFFSAEVPALFDWMRHQKRIFPLRQVGTDGVGTAFGNEFCTMRAEDNRFYWLSTSNISSRHLVSAGRWNNLAEPAAMTARIDPSTNEINVKTIGLHDVTVWLGRNPVGQSMIDFEKPVMIRIGLRTYFTGKVTPSLGVLLEEVYRRGDRKHLYLARVEMKIR
jgi:pimeloyl-ACP methyl ester carboxylesterase